MPAEARLLLASSSRTRIRMLRSAGVEIVAESPEVDEAAAKDLLRRKGATTLEAADALAELKALRVSRRHPGSVVLGADQILDNDGRWFDKPDSRATARAQLMELRGRSHTLVTAVVAVRDGRRLWDRSETASLTMRAFSDGFADAYLRAAGDAVLATVGISARRIGGAIVQPGGGGSFRYPRPAVAAGSRLPAQPGSAPRMIISGKARLAGVIGWPVSHSRSPRLHGWWLDHYRVDGAYLPLPVRPEDFERVLRCLPAMGFAGANVTVPHKEAALRAVDRVDAVAKRIGAVNTLVVAADGTIEGRNTDAHGFLENLRLGCPGWRPESGPAVVIGAGGASRAVCAALVDAGVPELRLVNRSPDRAEAVAADIGGPIRAIAWEDRSRCLSDAALLVNTTTLGMEGAPPLEIDLAGLPISAAVSDIVYAPLRTPLLAAAAARGHPVVDGLGMLLHQACPGFEAWFGIRPAVTAELRAFVLSEA